MLILYVWQDQFASSMLLEKVFHYLFTMPVSKGLSHFSHSKFNFRYKKCAVISLSVSYLIIELAMQEIQTVMKSFLQPPSRDSDLSYRL